MIYIGVSTVLNVLMAKKHIITSQNNMDNFWRSH